MNGWPVARLFGVEIRIHWSWVLILALVAVFTAAEVEAASPGLDAAVQWLIGGLVAAGFLASATIHDLAHAVMSRRRGVPVEALAVSFFGGSSPFDARSMDPGDEVVIAAAGPLVSLIAGSLLVAASLLVSLVGGATVEAVGLFGVLLGLLNILLGAVNFLPAYPLDGGRLFRALIWRRTGDERRGTRFVGRSGNLLGLAVLAGGLAVSIGDIGNGMMIMLCGWFLRLTARGALGQADLEQAADGLRAGDVMEPLGITISPSLTIDTFAGQVLDGDPPRSSVLVARGGDLVGIIGAAQIRRLPRGKWPTTRVEDVMVAWSKLAPIDADAPVWPVFLRLRDEGLDGLPVAGDAGPAGILTARAIAAAIRARQGVAGPRSRRPRR